LEPAPPGASGAAGRTRERLVRLCYGLRKELGGRRVGVLVLQGAATPVRLRNKERRAQRPRAGEQRSLPRAGPAAAPGGRPARAGGMRGGRPPRLPRAPPAARTPPKRLRPAAGRRTADLARNAAPERKARARADRPRGARLGRRAARLQDVERVERHRLLRVALHVHHQAQPGHPQQRQQHVAGREELGRKALQRRLSPLPRPGQSVTWPARALALHMPQCKQSRSLNTWRTSEKTNTPGRSRTPSTQRVIKHAHRLPRLDDVICAGRVA